MKNNANPLVNILLSGLRLLAICAVSGLVLSLVNGFTAPVIAVRQQADEAAALKELIPGGAIEPGQPVSSPEFPAVVTSYRLTAVDSPAAYILELTGNGYGGSMKIMASYRADGEVFGVKLMNNEETPGLGKKAEEPAYMRKFTGKGGRNSRDPVPLNKEMLSAQQSAGNPAAATTPQNRGFFRIIATALLGEPQTGNTDSVTGATITFSGISQAVAAGSEYIKKLNGSEP